MCGKSSEGLGVGRQYLNYGQIKANPNRKLDDHGAQTADGIYAGLLVKAHRLLRQACTIFAVATLEGLDPGL